MGSLTFSCDGQKPVNLNDVLWSDLNNDTIPDANEVTLYDQTLSDEQLRCYTQLLNGTKGSRQIRYTLVPYEKYGQVQNPLDENFFDPSSRVSMERLLNDIADQLKPGTMHVAFIFAPSDRFPRIRIIGTARNGKEIDSIMSSFYYGCSQAPICKAKVLIGALSDELFRLKCVEARDICTPPTPPDCGQK
ncbi:MAG: hypothetical protein ACD_62C00538G0004 [uncultured bacterium]|nr:MAG: hypothetical protein ACD_62C00538G0004 [uncultured bacterium]HLD44401.1 hypothetical protein [bacterium]